MFIPACIVLMFGILACGIVIKWPENPKVKRPVIYYKHYFIDKDGTLVYYKKIDIQA